MKAKDLTKDRLMPDGGTQVCNRNFIQRLWCKFIELLDLIKDIVDKLINGGYMSENDDVSNIGGIIDNLIEGGDGVVNLQIVNELTPTPNVIWPSAVDQYFNHDSNHDGWNDFMVKSYTSLNLVQSTPLTLASTTNLSSGNYTATPSSPYIGFSSVVLQSPVSAWSAPKWNTSTKTYTLDYSDSVSLFGITIASRANTGTDTSNILSTFDTSTMTGYVGDTGYPINLSTNSFSISDSHYGTTYDGVTTVVLNKPDNLQPGNIANGVTIFGITGTLVPNPAPTINLIKPSAVTPTNTNTPTANELTLNFSGYNYLNYNYSSAYDGFTQFWIGKPANLIAANIKKDVSIFGITGTYDPSTGGTGGTTIPSDTPYAITFTISKDGNVAPAIVILQKQGGGSTTQQASSSGVVTITQNGASVGAYSLEWSEMGAGTYTWTVTYNGVSKSSTSNVVLTNTNRQTTVNVVLSGTTAFNKKITIVVSDNDSGALLSGATVTLTNQNTGVILTGTTDSSGQAVFDNLATASYTWAVSKSGYVSKSSPTGSAVPTADSEGNPLNRIVNVPLQLQSTSGTLIIHVKDATTGAAISGASVIATIDGVANAQFTNSNGDATYTGVPYGVTLLYQVGKSGYIADDNGGYGVNIGTMPSQSTYTVTVSLAQQAATNISLDPSSILYKGLVAQQAATSIGNVWFNGAAVLTVPLTSDEYPVGVIIQNETPPPSGTPLWDVTNIPSWVTVTKYNTKSAGGYGNQILVVKVTSTSSTTRTGTMTITSAGGATTTLTITQQTVGVKLTLSPASAITVSPDRSTGLDYLYYNAGEIIYIDYNTAISGYTFTNWSVSPSTAGSVGATTNPSAALTISSTGEDLTLTANRTAITYWNWTLNAIDDANGNQLTYTLMVDGTQIGTTFSAPTTVTELSSLTSHSYMISAGNYGTVTGSIASGNSSNVSYVARLTSTLLSSYSLFVQDGRARINGGLWLNYSTEVQVAPGASVEIEAQIKSGFTFAQWAGNTMYFENPVTDIINSTPQAFTMPASGLVFIANYQADTPSASVPTAINWYGASSTSITKNGSGYLVVQVTSATTPSALGTDWNLTYNYEQYSNAGVITNYIGFGGWQLISSSGTTYVYRINLTGIGTSSIVRYWSLAVNLVDLVNGGASIGTTTNKTITREVG